jgi:Uma2 family endonuclease
MARMGNAAEPLRMSGAEFLVWEAAQSEKHEFVAGEVFAMAGAEDRHVTVAGNLYVALRHHLRGTPCRTFMSDMKLAVAAEDSYFYPDWPASGWTCRPSSSSPR